MTYNDQNPDQYQDLDTETQGEEYNEPADELLDNDFENDAPPPEPEPKRLSRRERGEIANARREEGNLALTRKVEEIANRLNSLSPAQAPQVKEQVAKSNDYDDSYEPDADDIALYGSREGAIQADKRIQARLAKVTAKFNSELENVKQTHAHKSFEQFDRGLSQSNPFYKEVLDGKSSTAQDFKDWLETSQDAYGDDYKEVFGKAITGQNERKINAVLNAYKAESGYQEPRPRQNAREDYSIPSRQQRQAPPRQRNFEAEATADLDALMRGTISAEDHMARDAARYKEMSRR